MPRSPGVDQRRAEGSSSRHLDEDRDRGRSHRHSDRDNGSSSHRRGRDDDYQRDHKRSRTDALEDGEKRHDSRQASSSHRHRDRDGDRDRNSDARHHRSSKPRETSLERRERKRAEKAARKSNPAEADERAKLAEMLMYSAEDNPFNDANLGSQFKWGKKEEKEKRMGMTPEQARMRDAERRREAEEEISKLNARRAEREKAQVLREEEEARMARLQESAAMSEWVAKEDDFYLEQSKRRAIIRVRENRAKPIDLLALNLRWADPDRETKEREKTVVEREQDEEDDEAGLEIDLEEPYKIFDNLNLAEIEELHHDIQMYLSLEKNESNLDFWRSMIIVCEDRVDEAQGLEDRSSRIDPSVRIEMNKMLSSKTHDQLLTLQDQVQAKLRSGEPVDVEYWEGLLKSIVVWRAKAKLRALHSVVLSNRIEHLRKKQRQEALRQQTELAEQVEDDADDEERPEDLAPEASLPIRSVQERADAEYDATEMDPPSIPANGPVPRDDQRWQILDEPAELSSLMEARKRIISSLFVPRARQAPGKVAKESEEDVQDASAAMYRAEASKALDVEEEAFNQAEEMARQSYSWEDKYRPRKPRYFNRVHTGYEWNKYNQTHYDTDNPPPKVVQGYKFNIFYPDLIDKTKAPSYQIIKIPDDPDTVLLKFTAGPPYEDVAFRIVNKPWEMGHKKGFRNSFDRGVLQLYFNFARLRYRK